MIWFTSDHHFYHTNVIRYCSRPFSSVEEMNEVMVERWNEVVRPEDTVYHLGDFSLAHRAVTVFVPKLNGTKHLIAGNHDHCHPAHHKNKGTKRERMEALYLEAGFASIALAAALEIGGNHVLLHHMPYQGDHDKERYTKYRPKDEGAWLLHGHVHEKWKQRGRMINVGVDVWDFRPVSIVEIEALLGGH
jgi:calcineurin-like phosphoesterase family protein